MVLAVEIIVCCLIFGIYRVIRIKRDPAYKISNMPENCRKRSCICVATEIGISVS